MSKSSKADIYHLYHSGVAVKTPNSLLIFDYYKDTSKGQERSLKKGVITPEVLKEKEDVLVFVTHNHSDHFNSVIFDWEDYTSNINYILSNDVRAPNRDSYYKMGKYQSLNIGNFEIETYGTTDQGLSYLVKVDGVTIFHAGDLNWWHWKKFTPQERKREEEDFKTEIEKFKGEEIDIAFVPVDPRLEEYYYLAGEYFAEMIVPKLFVPIHFSSNYSITKEFKEKIKEIPVETAVIEGRGEKIVFK